LSQVRIVEFGTSFGTRLEGVADGHRVADGGLIGADDLATIETATW
jgi:hypothetical protein